MLFLSMSSYFTDYRLLCFFCLLEYDFRDRYFISFSLNNKLSQPYVLSVATLATREGLTNKEIEKLLKIGNLSDLDNDCITLGENFFKQFIFDIKAFPLIPQKGVYYEAVVDLEEKQYATAIFPAEGKLGTTKVVSITDGQIEKIRWTQNQGYEVGIRTNGGAYFSYSYLSANPSHLTEGAKIKAGERIGNITQYLQLGIKVTLDEETFWVLPENLLLYLEKYI